jgi:predicted RNA-binding protein YlxR (DUF448 family)
VNKGHVPTRQCVVCKTRTGKPALMRFVHNGGTWLADSSGREAGRGAYLCSPECARGLQKNKRYRALAEVAIRSSLERSTQTKAETR